MADARQGYNPGEEYEEDTRDPLVDISLTDSKELWLIQWPIKQLTPGDFHGKEIKLKLRDGKLGTLENSSGKTFEMVSFAAQEPDATVFLPTSSTSKVVGKISRRVCLRRYPDPDELEQPSVIDPRSHRGGSWRNSSLHTSVHRGTSARSHRTLTSAHSMDGRSIVTPQPSSKKRREDQRAGDVSSNGSRPVSLVTDTSIGSEKSKEKSKKKKEKA